MKKKVRKATSQDLLRFQDLTKEDIDDVKRQDRAPIMEAVDIANINVLVSVVDKLIDIIASGQPLDAQEEIRKLQEPLRTVQAYKERLKDLELEAIKKVPEDIGYYMRRGK